MEPDDPNASVAELAPPLASESAPETPKLLAVSAPNPKATLFGWCSKRKVPSPVFTMTAAPGNGFEGRAQLTLPDGTLVASNAHPGRSHKIVEHAASAELLTLLERLLGPEMIPPPRAPKKPPKGVPQPSPEAIVAARELAKVEARRERQEALRRLLSTASSANVRETFTLLKVQGYVRGVRIEVIPARAGSRVLMMEAQCVRPDGATVHVMPFKAASKEAGEAFAIAQLVESIAASAGISLRVSSGEP